jgi:hypothetical protein
MRWALRGATGACGAALLLTPLVAPPARAAAIFLVPAFVALVAALVRPRPGLIATTGALAVCEYVVALSAAPDLLATLVVPAGVLVFVTLELLDALAAEGNENRRILAHRLGWIAGTASVGGVVALGAQALGTALRTGHPLASVLAIVCAAAAVALLVRMTRDALGDAERRSGPG